MYLRYKYIESLKEKDSRQDFHFFLFKSFPPFFPTTRGQKFVYALLRRKGQACALNCLLPGLSREIKQAPCFVKRKRGRSYIVTFGNCCVPKWSLCDIDLRIPPSLAWELFRYRYTFFSVVSSSFFVNIEDNFATPGASRSCKICPEWNIRFDLFWLWYAGHIHNMLLMVSVQKIIVI